MHDFQVKVMPGHVCLACHHCGKRSGGWEMSPPMGVASQSTAVKAEARTPSLDHVPVRMAKVLHHAPRNAQPQKRAAAN